MIQDFANESVKINKADSLPCPICYDALDPLHSMKFECGHTCCTNCWENIISSANSEFKALDNLKCFDPTCKAKILDIKSKIEVIQNEDVKKRFWYLMKRQEIHKDADKFICPNGDCLKILDTKLQADIKEQ